MHKKEKGFFSFTENLPYQSPNSLGGQLTVDSCVAAVARMLLADEGIEIIETYLRVVLGIDEEGAWLSDLPDLLATFGASKRYAYRHDLTF